MNTNDCKYDVLRLWFWSAICVIVAHWIVLGALSSPSLAPTPARDVVESFQVDLASATTFAGQMVNDDGNTADAATSWATVDSNLEHAKEPQSSPTQNAKMSEAAILARIMAEASTNVPSNWQSKIRAMLKRRQYYSAGPKEKDIAGTTLVAFTIDRRGHLLEVHVKDGSGSSVLDDEALRLVKRMQPFPPLPAEAEGEYFSAQIPVEFDAELPKNNN